MKSWRRQRSASRTLFLEREMNALIKKTSLLKLVRGKGLLNAIVVNDTPDRETAWNLCVKFAEVMDC